MFKVPNQYRIRQGPMGSDDSYGLSGAFEIPYNGGSLFIIAANGEGWEHVSVHYNYRDRNITPDWSVMCKVKDLFWDSEDCVVQFHPPKSVHVNHHPNVLHLWRKKGVNWETPPEMLIG